MKQGVDASQKVVKASRMQRELPMPEPLRHTHQSTTLSVVDNSDPYKESRTAVPSTQQPHSRISACLQRNCNQHAAILLALI